MNAERAPSLSRIVAALLLALAMLIFAHGCHGPDVDHELFARRIWMK